MNSILLVITVLRSSPWSQRANRLWLVTPYDDWYVVHQQIMYMKLEVDTLLFYQTYTNCMHYTDINKLKYTWLFGQQGRTFSQMVVVYRGMYSLRILMDPMLLYYSFCTSKFIDCFTCRGETIGLSWLFKHLNQWNIITNFETPTSFILLCEL